MVEKEVRIVNKLGLHARPAVLLVKVARQFQCDITLQKDDIAVDAKSILGILLLAAEKGSKIRIITDGKDEKEAIEVISRMFEEGFEEE